MTPEHKFYVILLSAYTVSLIPAFVGCIQTYIKEVPNIKNKATIYKFLALLAIAIFADGFGLAFMVIYFFNQSKIFHLVGDLLVSISLVMCVAQLLLLAEIVYVLGRQIKLI